MSSTTEQVSLSTIDPIASYLKVKNLLRGKLPTSDGAPLWKRGERDLGNAVSSCRSDSSECLSVRPLTKSNEAAPEDLRAKVGSVDGVHVLRKILELCLVSRDRQTSHLDLFWKLWPGERFDGLGANSRITIALKAATLSCLEYGLPQLTTLVVIRKSRRLSKRDMRRIHQTVSCLNYDVGMDDEAFVSEQASHAAELIEDLFDAMLREFMKKSAIP